jgi:YidC/Oxa1 family membrane protein insertase
MDRQSVVGFILIFIVLVVWMWLNSPVPRPKPVEQTATPAQVRDTMKENLPKPQEISEKQDVNPYGKFFSDRAKGTEKIISIETDFYSAEISSKGGVLKKWELKQFKTWDGYPVQLVTRKTGILRFSSLRLMAGSLTLEISILMCRHRRSTSREMEILNLK